MIDPLLKRLHDWEKVRGVTVFRGVTGFFTGFPAGLRPAFTNPLDRFGPWPGLPTDVRIPNSGRMGQ